MTRAPWSRPRRLAALVAMPLALASLRMAHAEPAARATAPSVSSSSRPAPSASSAPSASAAPSASSSSAAASSASPGGLAPPTIARALFRVVHALPDAPSSGGIFVDPPLEPLRPQLVRPPLSAWKTFKLLRADELPVRASGPTTLTLPDGQPLRVQVAEAGVDASVPDRRRVRVEVKVGERDPTTTTAVVDDGGTLVVAGAPLRGGVVVVAITLTLVPR